MFLIVGLGNPGPKYALTRHNIGFLALDLFAEGLGARSWNEEHKAHTVKFKVEEAGKEHQVLLAKPMTFMNKSGESVVALMNFYKIPKENMLVVYDEIDVPYGKMKLQTARSPGGHNGIKNITELLGHNQFARLRLGVSRPPHPEMDVADYVLSKFSLEEQDALPDFLNRAGDAIDSFIFNGLEKTANLFNQK